MGMRKDNKIISVLSLTFMGASNPFPFRHRSPPYYPVLFVLPRLTRILTLLHVIVYSRHAIPRPPHSYRRLPETKKKKLDKKNHLHRDASDGICGMAPLFCVLSRTGRPNFLYRYQLRSRAYKLLHAMASRRVINNRNLRVIPFSQALFLLLFHQIHLAPCPTTPPPLPPTITPLQVTATATATDKGVSAYATLVGPSSSPQSSHSVSVVVVYVTHLPFCPCDPEH